MQSYSEVEADYRTGKNAQSPFSLGSGLLTWLVYVLLMVVIQAVAAIVYIVGIMVKTGAMPKPEDIVTLSFALIAIASTFVAHILTVLFGWGLITKRLRLPFLQTLGWNWHPQFKLPHAIALGGLMMGMAIVFSKLLLHRETEMDKMLKLGLSVRLLVVVLAVFSAPFVEELVFRGILYPAVEARAGWIAGIGVTSLLFGLVHVPQYWGSPAAITTIMVLSVVLTVLRAYTGSLLPSVVTHFIYNGIQSVMLLLGLADDGGKEQAQQAVIISGRWLGLW